MTQESIKGWFAGRLPDDWFTGPPEIKIDRDEILVIGSLAEPKLEDPSEEARQAARRSRMAGFREDSRARRMHIAAEAETAFQRKVSWGVRVGEETVLFTHLGAPAMTRLRMAERKVLDTLVDAGVARSRSDALAWCVRLVGQHESDWVKELRDALAKVEEARAKGPSA